MNDSQKKQIIDAINEQLNKMHDDYHVLMEYGVDERRVLSRAIKDLEATQRKIVRIFEEEDNE